MRYIFPDTRQQAGKHDVMHETIAAEKDIVLASSIALPAGDYMALESGTNVFPEFRKTSVDTKKDMTELCACLTRDNKRFVAEFKRAADMGIRLYILTIDKAVALPDPFDVSGVWQWVNPRSWFAKGKKIPQGPQLAKAIHTIEERYCDGERRFLFASNQQEAGEIICKLLYKPTPEEVADANG